MADSLVSKIMGLEGKFGLKAARKSESEIYLTRKVLQKRWWNIFGKGNKTMIFRAKITLDNYSKTLNYSAKLKEYGSTKGAMEAGYSTYQTRGKLIDTKIKTRGWGIREKGGFGEIYNVDFNPIITKEQVKTIAKSKGWKFNG